MEFTLWISFVGTVSLLALTPGPRVLLATANSMKYGPRKTIGTILGDLTANLCQIILASAGLATIITASGELFQAIKWFGVLYLVYMGVRKLISNPQINLRTGNSNSRGFWNLYGEGFLMSAANPKAVVFFAALFPLFIAGEYNFWLQVVILAVTFLVIDGLSLLVYTQFAKRLKSYLEDSKKVHLQNKIVGTLLIASGLLLSTVSNSTK